MADNVKKLKEYLDVMGIKSSYYNLGIILENGKKYSREFIDDIVDGTGGDRGIDKVIEIIQRDNSKKD